MKTYAYTVDYAERDQDECQDTRAETVVAGNISNALVTAGNLRKKKERIVSIVEEHEVKICNSLTGRQPK